MSLVLGFIAALIAGFLGATEIESLEVGIGVALLVLEYRIFNTRNRIDNLENWLAKK